MINYIIINIYFTVTIYFFLFDFLLVLEFFRLSLKVHSIRIFNEFWLNQYYILVVD